MLVLVLCMVAKGDFTFGEPTNLGPTINISSYETAPSTRGDGLELYFESDRDGGEGTYDIWVSTRATKDDDWGAATNLAAINTPDWQVSPCISDDGLELYWDDWGLWVARRATVSDPWGEPENDSLININAIGGGSPCLSSDGLSLFLASPWPKDWALWEWDLYVSTRPTRDDLWSEPVNLGPTVNGVNSTSLSRCPTISADGLVLIFSSDRDGGYGDEDLWMTRRTTIDGPWSEPVNLGPTINSDRLEFTPEISPDGRSLLFSSNRREGRYGQFDIWQAEVHPVVDLNGDGIVDAADMVIVVDHWGEDYPLCDIGPTPFGDGIVDVQDLIVIAEHLFEVYGLIHHWTLDETGGATALDSIGDKDAVLHGGPLWQPTAGRKGGALAFDGENDYLTIPFILDPAVGSFGAFAWIKGTERGRAIVSQNDSSGFSQLWLGTDASGGRLITRLMHPPFTPLMSEAIITDGQWHHVGLVYDIDKLYRYLYVDGAKVAEDIDFAGGVSLDGGLFIGIGEGLNLATCWSGLIDDVRIYDNALSEEAVAILAQ